MANSYNADSIHRLLRALLGPTWGERKAADSHLFSLMTCVPPDGNPALTQLIDDATNRFDYQEEAFFRELTGFWMDTCAQAYAARMRTFALEPLADGMLWPAREMTSNFPMRGAPHLEQFDMYGVGIGWYLVTQARRLTFQVDTLTRGLSHPEPTVMGTCWKLLGSIPRHARAALDAMLSIALRKGTRFTSDEPMRWLAAIYDAHPDEKTRLMTVLSEPAEDHRAPVVAALAQHMAMVPPELFASLLRRLDFLKDAEQRFAIMRALAELAQHDRAGPSRLVLRRAEKLLASPEPADRAGAAWAIASLSTPALHEAQLLALLRDEDWMPRSDAAAAAAQWTEPSPALLAAVANLLGDYDGYDGQPHDNALETLIAWGQHAAMATPQIAAWITADLDSEPPSSETVWRLIRALGEPGAAALRDAVSTFVDAHTRHHAKEIDDAHDHERGPFSSATTLSGARVERGGMSAALAEALADALNKAQEDIDARLAVHEAEQVNMADLLQRAGIDPNEEIPGTRTQAERAADPEPIDEIKQWLQRTR
jgi:hypothetical protein